MSKLSQFVVRHQVQDGYAVAWVAEQIARRLRCSTDEVLGSALTDQRAAEYLLNVVKNLQARA